MSGQCRSWPRERIRDISFPEIHIKDEVNTLPWVQNDNCRILFASVDIGCVFVLKEITLFIRVTVVTYVNAIQFYAIGMQF